MLGTLYAIVRKKEVRNHETKNNGTVLIGLLILAIVIISGCTEDKTMPPEPTPEIERIVSERLIVQIDLSSLIPESFKVSPDNKRVAYVSYTDYYLVVDGKVERPYGGLQEDSFISKQGAYISGMQPIEFVVVDGKLEKPYNNIENLIFSPDSKRVGYFA